MNESNHQLTEETAGVVVVEAEILQAIYVLLHFGMDVSANSDVPLTAQTRVALSKLITRLLNDFYNNGVVAWDTYGIEHSVIKELFDEIRDGIALAPVFMEDAIGFTVVDGTNKVLVHFTEEGLINGCGLAEKPYSGYAS